MATPQIGDQIESTTLNDLQGNSYELSDLFSNYTLLHFWSMTCMTCMRSAGELQKAKDKYEGKVQFVSVNMDTNKSFWHQGAKRDGISWLNLNDGKGVQGGIGKSLGIMAYPAYILLNEEGKIVDRWMGFKEGKIDQKIKENI
jgi:peroxiredoxin